MISNEQQQLIGGFINSVYLHCKGGEMGEPQTPLQTSAVYLFI